MIAFQWIGVMTYARGERSCAEHMLARHKLHNTPMPLHSTDMGIIDELEMTSLRATPGRIPIALSSGVVFLAPTLVDAGCPFPIKDVHQSPGILIQLDLQLSLLIECKLGQRVEDAGALAPVTFVNVEFPAR